MRERRKLTHVRPVGQYDGTKMLKARVYIAKKILAEYHFSVHRLVLFINKNWLFLFSVKLFYSEFIFPTEILTFYRFFFLKIDENKALVLTYICMEP